MPLKIGDKVKFLDDEGDGIVIRVNGHEILVDSSTGFREWHSSEALLLQDKLEIETVTIKDKPSILINLKKPPRIKEKWEVDIHASELFPSLSGLANHDILSKQLKTAKGKLKEASNQKIGYLIIIHGVGEGVLKSKIHEWLNTLTGIEYYDAEYKSYGKGATEVKIIRFA